MYIGAQFKTVHQSLLALTKATVPLTTKKYSKDDCEKLLKHLSRIIQRHVDTIKLTNDVSELFELIILIQFLTAAFIIGLGLCLLTIFTTPMEIILYSCLVLVFLTQLYFYCHGGTFVIKRVRAQNIYHILNTFLLLILEC